MLPEELFVGCPHPQESRGRDAPFSGEEMKLLEFSVENVGHLVFRQKKGKRDGCGTVDEHGLGVS